MEKQETEASIEEGWSDIGGDAPQELDTLPAIIHQFIKVVTTNTEYISNTTHPHTSLANIYAVATTLQASITPNTPPLKRNISLRDLAQRLHLWPTDIIDQLQRDASLSTSLLNEYIKATLKHEMEFVEKCYAKENLKETRVSMQIGNYHGAGEELPSVALKKLATLRYQACLVLERLETILTMQVEKGVLEGEENLELKDLKDMLPEINIVRNTAKEKMEMREGLCEHRANAFKAVQEYQNAVNTTSDELLRLLNEEECKEQPSGLNISELRKRIGKLCDTQTMYPPMKAQLRILFGEERCKDKRQR
jgi:hypothetical protein